MAAKMTDVIQHLCRLAVSDGAGRTDGELLNAFVRQRDEHALAVLVHRHGPMVWGVCRRLLRVHQDAEDAFQATFLVLVHKAAAVRDKGLLANWLYGVAQQTAVRMRATAARRQARERPMVDMPASAVRKSGDALLPYLDQELSRLPDKYRSVIVLCDLEGKTRKEAARQLGCPEGTVAGRLARARIMLANRLAKHGLTLAGAALAASLTQKASACVPTSVLVSTIKAATLTAAGQAVAGLISTKVAALTEGVLKTMLLTKLKSATAALFLMLGMTGLGAGLVTHGMASARQGGDGVTKASDGAKVPPGEGKAKKGDGSDKANPPAPPGKHARASRVLDAMEGFRKKIPPDTRGLFAGTGRVYKGLEPYTMPHLVQVADGLGVSTRTECLMLITYLKDGDLKLRYIAMHAINKATNAYPSGMNVSCFADTGSEEYRKMLLRFLQVIEKLPIALAVAPSDDAASWSKPTRGLQARITLVEKPKFNGTRSIVPYLELRNVSGSAHPMKVRCDDGHVKFELIDADGKVVRSGDKQPRDSMHAGPGTIVLPSDSSMRIGMAAGGWGVPEDAPAMILTDSGAWIFEPQEKGKVFLRATVEAAKVESDPDRTWYGTIETPPVKVDWRE